MKKLHWTDSEFDRTYFLLHIRCYGDVPTAIAITVSSTAGGYDFRPISRFISEMIQDRAIVTMERQKELVCDLWNAAICNDLE